MCPVCMIFERRRLDRPRYTIRLGMVCRRREKQEWAWSGSASNVQAEFAKPLPHVSNPSSSNPESVALVPIFFQVWNLRSVIHSPHIDKKGSGLETQGYHSTELSQWLPSALTESATGSSGCKGDRLLNQLLRGISKCSLVLLKQI